MSAETTVGEMSDDDFADIAAVINGEILMAGGAEVNSAPSVFGGHVVSALADIGYVIVPVPEVGRPVTREDVARAMWDSVDLSVMPTIPGGGWVPWQHLSEDTIAMLLEQADVVLRVLDGPEGAE